MAQHVTIDPHALVVLIGAAGSGKSTFAHRHFPGEAIVSSDDLRATLASAHPKRRRKDVFEPLLAIVADRMATGTLTVVDATNTNWMRRSELIRMARRYGRPTVAMVFQLPLDVTLSRNSSRPDAVPASTVRRQVAAIDRDIDRLDLEGFAAIVRLQSDDDLGRAPVDIDDRATRIARSGS